MTGQNNHPVPTAFNALTQLKHYILGNPNDPVARFVASCAVSFFVPSQLFQELFVLFVLKNKRGGFFVEFGATDGQHLSNTFILESQFGWKGILAEPARVWQAALSKNRKAKIDFRCVWKTSGETVKFNETTAPELATISQFTEGDANSFACITNQEYDVKTISLTDLLDENKAPTVVDYLSIDTEGSEYEILSHFNFKKYRFNVITVEHNFVEPARTDIQKLLESHGYVRYFTAFSQWDDWYVHGSIKF